MTLTLGVVTGTAMVQTKRHILGLVHALYTGLCAVLLLGYRLGGACNDWNGASLTKAHFSSCHRWRT
jgi:hypothetical protein